jgi:hypothetical protein
MYEWIPAAVTAVVGVLAIVYQAGGTGRAIKDMREWIGEHKKFHEKRADEIRACQAERRQEDSALHGRVTELRAEVAHLGGRLNGAAHHE